MLAKCKHAQEVSKQFISFIQKAEYLSRKDVWILNTLYKYFENNVNGNFEENNTSK